MNHSVLWRVLVGVSAATIASAAWYTNAGAKLPVEGELVRVVVGLSFVGSGALASIYFRNTRIAALMTAVGLMWFLWDVSWIYLPWPYTLGLLFGSAYQPVLAHLAVAFPTGSLRTRLDRTVVLLAYVSWLLLTIATLAVWDPQVDCPGGCSTNLLLLDPDSHLHDVIDVTGTVVGLALTSMVLGIVTWHWYAARVAERRALAPFLWSCWPIAAILVAIELAGRSQVPPLASIALTALPIAFLFGLLRMQLARTAVGNLVIELGQQLGPRGLRDALARALRDPDLELLYWSREQSTFIDTAGQRAALPACNSGRVATILENADQPLAALVHDVAFDQDRELVQAAAAAARLAIENERLQAEIRAQLQEVRASRARLVEASDAARRRLERDLHDGSQQHLVTLAVQLSLAQARLDDQSDPELAALLNEAIQELRVALGEIRQLARGIHPAILSEAGLGPALSALAERCPVPVAILTVPEGRLAAAVESAVYFVVAESMTNAAKHAQASTVSVRAEVVDGQIRVEVTDDGIGGANVEAGSGLQGLADRVGALDGHLEVCSPRGGGTVVTAVIPYQMD